jgi:hypothetical protein
MALDNVQTIEGIASSIDNLVGLVHTDLALSTVPERNYIQRLLEHENASKTPTLFRVNEHQIRLEKPSAPDTDSANVVSSGSTPIPYFVENIKPLDVIGHFLGNRSLEKPIYLKPDLLWYTTQKVLDKINAPDYVPHKMGNRSIKDFKLKTQSMKLIQYKPINLSEQSSAKTYVQNLVNSNSNEDKRNPLINSREVIKKVPVIKTNNVQQINQQVAKADVPVKASASTSWETNKSTVLSNKQELDKTKDLSNKITNGTTVAPLNNTVLNQPGTIIVNKTKNVPEKTVATVIQGTTVENAEEKPMSSAKIHAAVIESQDTFTEKRTIDIVSNNKADVQTLTSTASNATVTSSQSTTSSTQLKGIPNVTNHNTINTTKSSTIPKGVPVKTISPKPQQKTTVLTTNEAKTLKNLSSLYDQLGSSISKSQSIGTKAKNLSDSSIADLKSYLQTQVDRFQTLISNYSTQINDRVTSYKDQVTTEVNKYITDYQTYTGTWQDSIIFTKLKISVSTIKDVSAVVNRLNELQQI